MIKHINHYVIM